MNDEILRSEFEMSALFQTANETVGDITYKNFGGYFINDTPYLYMNGAFAMFKELYCDIGCKHNWVGKSENQHCSKCGIGDE